MLYSSERTQNFLQRNKSEKLFTRRSYTFNLRTYKDAADKDSRILIRNMEGEEELLVARVAIRKHLADIEHGKVWRHFLDRMRKAGYSVYFVREWDEENHLHYHLVIRPDRTLPNNRNLHTDIRQSIPAYIRSHCEVYPRQDDITAVISPVGYARYIHKAETMITDLLGNKIDINAKDRRLYPKQTSLKKIGSHRTFWKRTKKTLWREIIEENKSKSDKSKPEQKELKQHQTRLENHLLTIATPQQHQTAINLFNLSPEIQERTILLNQVWFNLTPEQLDTLPKFNPKKYPDDCELPKISMGNYDDIDERQERLKDIIAGV